MGRKRPILMRFLFFLATALIAILPSANSSGQDSQTAPVDPVVIGVTVADSKKNLVNDLKAEDFEISEDNKPQQITSVSSLDAPASIGILVDNSGSMRAKRFLVLNAMMSMLNASNPQNEIFVVNFNDDSFLDVDFTSDLGKVREALARQDARGGTALYDTIIASADHFAQAKNQKHILVVVTDGADNESRESLQKTIAHLQSANGPTVFSVGVQMSEPSAGRARKALDALSAQTGGEYFLAGNLKDLDKIAPKIAEAIRDQYVITYQSANARSDGAVRQIKASVRRSGLIVKNRPVYIAGKPLEAKQADKKTKR